MNLVLELLDVPGQLVSALEPISGLGANLVTVIHKRDSKNENGKIPVQLTLEGEQENLNRVIDRFDDLGFTIIEKDGVINKEFISTILIGHIVDKDVRDTTDRINALDGVYVVGFDIKFLGLCDFNTLLYLFKKSDVNIVQLFIEISLVPFVSKY